MKSIKPNKTTKVLKARLLFYVGRTVKPHTYLRYMDDAFLLFNNSGQTKAFLNYQNTQHNHINFTKEERNSTPPFAILVHKEVHFQAIVYRKKRST